MHKSNGHKRKMDTQKRNEGHNVTELMRENSLLREQLEDARLQQHQSEHRLRAAEKSIDNLESELDKAHWDLVNSQNKVASLNLKMDLWKMRVKADMTKTCAANGCTDESQTGERDLSELILRLQKAHEDLEKCTAKLQLNMDHSEEDRQEQHETTTKLKSSIMDLSVRVQEEQVTLMKKAIKLVPCNNDDKCSSQQNKEAEQLEKVNLQLQKLNKDLMQQALSLKPSGTERKKNKHQWYRTHRDQEQQTEPLESAVSELQPQNDKQDLKEDAATNQNEKDLLLLEIQQLKDKLHAEEALRVTKETMALELEAELSRRDSAQKEAEERLQMHVKQWQDERAALQNTIERLQETLREKQQDWTLREKHMVSRLDDLETKMTEVLEKKSKKKKSWLARHFKRFRAD